MDSVAHTAPTASPPPTNRDVRPRPDPVSTAVPHRRVAIVGAGFGGLGMAIRLLQRGERDFVVLEKGRDVGGTWRDNTYPGCQCDVASAVYSFSFAPNPNWSRSYAEQAEIWQYLRDCADKFGVRPFIRFDTELTRAHWDDATQRWHIETNNSRFTADILVSGHGGLSAPSIPELPGLERFAGTVFHSAEWNHDHDISGERVAVVGTGASSIQIVPSIQPRVRELHLFQRTPAWIAPRVDFTFSARTKFLFRKLPVLHKLDRARLYLFREVVVLAMRGNLQVRRIIETLAKKHLESQVPDAKLREKLTPSYEIGCKRILISNEFYPALAQPNVRLVTEAITEVRRNGLVTSDGTLHEVDTIVLATGFRVTNHPVTFRLFGREGRSLGDSWTGGAAAYLGTTVSGFPNLFLLTGPYTGIGHNSIVYMLESQFEYVLGALDALREQHAAVLDVKSEIVRAFADEMQSALKDTVWNSGCASWYLDKNGKNTSVWPTFTWRFRNRTRRFDAAAYTFEARRAALEPALRRHGE